MMKSFLLIVFYLSISQCFGQRFSLDFGIHSEADYSKEGNLFQLNDSLFILALDEKSLRLNTKNDPRLFISLSYQIIEKDKWYVKTQLFYHRRYLDIDLAEIEEFGGSDQLVTRGIIPNRNSSVMFFGKLGGTFRKLSLETGFGFGFHFKNISDAISDDRPDYNLIYKSAEKMHRSITFNYQLQGTFRLFKRISVFARFNESIGSTTSSFKLFGEVEETPLKWRSIGFGLAYHFDLPFIKNKGD